MHELQFVLRKNECGAHADGLKYMDNNNNLYK